MSSYKVAIPPRGRQARARAARAAVREHALRLFLRDGYATTTVEAIAETAGISRRTFFRYFPSKEDVVVLRTEDVGIRLGELVRDRPSSEPPLTAINAALQPIIAEYARDPVRTRALLRLTLDTPELRARNKDIQELWVRAVRGEILARYPNQGPMFAEVVASTALATMNVGLGHWLTHGGDLAKLIDEAFAVLTTALTRAE